MHDLATRIVIQTGNTGSFTQSITLTNPQPPAIRFIQAVVPCADADALLGSADNFR